MLTVDDQRPCEIGEVENAKVPRNVDGIKDIAAGWEGVIREP